MLWYVGGIRSPRLAASAVSFMDQMAGRNGISRPVGPTTRKQNSHNDVPVSCSQILSQSLVIDPGGPFLSFQQGRPISDSRRLMIAHAAGTYFGGDPFVCLAKIISNSGGLDAYSLLA